MPVATTFKRSTPSRPQKKKQQGNSFSDVTTAITDPVPCGCIDLPVVTSRDGGIVSSKQIASKSNFESPVCKISVHIKGPQVVKIDLEPSATVHLIACEASAR